MDKELRELIEKIENKVDDIDNKLEISSTITAKQWYLNLSITLMIASVALIDFSVWAGVLLFVLGLFIMYVIPLIRRF